LNTYPERAFPDRFQWCMCFPFAKNNMNTAPRIIASHDEAEKIQTAAFMKLAARLGWQITFVDDLGIHLRKKKQYGTGYLLIGALTAIIGIGFLIWIVGLLDYLASSDRVLFIPHKDIQGDDAIKAADLLL
jgi:hypothetical protein